MKERHTSNWTRKKLLKFSLISVLLLLLLAEGVARIVFYFRFHGTHTSIYVQGSSIQVDDTISVYNNRPYYADYQKRFQYNEEGMKSDIGDYRIPSKGANDLWVLLLGGSAMEGMGSNKDGKWFDITNVQDHPYSENIAAYLQTLLEEKCPGRKVKVFNAAVSGFTIYQGFQRYKYLSEKYDFDWVITMDGVNECDTLQGDEEKDERGYSELYFSTYPFHRWPLKYIVPITQHSAFFNMLKQELYYVKLNMRMGRNEAKGFPERKVWGGRETTPLTFADEDARVILSSRAFIKELLSFEARLKQDGKKYLMLVQPYLAFRDPSVLTEEERALMGYLRAAHNDRYKHSFFKNIYDTIGVISRKDSCIRRMSEVYEWPGWIFVDYCHLTAKANEKIARNLADYISTDGKLSIFDN